MTSSAARGPSVEVHDNGLIVIDGLGACGNLYDAACTREDAVAALRSALGEAPRVRSTIGEALSRMADRLDTIRRNNTAANVADDLRTLAAAADPTTKGTPTCPR